MKSVLVGHLTSSLEMVIVRDKTLHFHNIYMEMCRAKIKKEVGI